MGATASVAAALVPHPFVAVTVMLPDAIPTVALMLAVVDVPAQPAGNVHV